MRLGRFPGQEEALREVLAERRRRERRAWLRIGLVGLVVGGAVGFWGGWSVTRPDRSAPQHARLSYAHRLATGPLDDLLFNYAQLLDVVDATGGDPTLWTGVRRLCDYAQGGRGPRLDTLRRALVLTLSHGEPPADLRRQCERLRKAAKRGR